MIGVISPGFAATALGAGTFTEEKEKMTYDFLLMTPMRPTSILLAKLLSTVGTMALIVIGTLPVYSVGFLIGRTTPAAEQLQKSLVSLTPLYSSTYQ